jgi:hypothetical protein
LFISIEISENERFKKKPFRPLSSVKIIQNLPKDVKGPTSWKGPD